MNTAKTLTELHQQSVVTTVLFRAEAFRQGYRRTNAAFDGAESGFGCKRKIGRSC